MMATATIPYWLEEQCFRLKDETSELRCLNLNIRRLDFPMMQELCKALCSCPTIEAINMTSSVNMVPRPQPHHQHRHEHEHQHQHHPLQRNHSNQANIIHAEENGMILPLAHVLRNHPSLKQIYLSYNRLEHIESLGWSLATNQCLEELYLDYNQINDASAISLANGLRKNQTLKVLQLKSNKIGDQGAIAFAMALRENKTLRFLGLNRNMIGSNSNDGDDAIAKAFLYALEENITLTHLEIRENPILDYQESPSSSIAVSVALIEYIVRANQAGRYLLRWTWYDLQSLWPTVLENLDPDMLYFFLRSFPALMR